MARPNAVIEEWLAEWRDEAKQKGHQSQHTFAKALASLRAYPLALNSGAEAQILKNFGPALCQMIDKRLAQERKNPTTTKSSQSLPDTSAGAAIEAPAVKVVKKTTAKAAKHAQAASNDFGSGSEAEASPSASPKKRPRTTGPKPKEYLPAYRSGGFAILIALLEHSRDAAATRSYMTKTELIDAAQPNCDTSFKPQARGGMPMGPNAFFYTAWSSMATLIKKALVLKEGNPARFTLTETGKQLAERLQSGISNGENDGGEPRVSSQKQPVKAPAVVKSTSTVKATAVRPKNDIMASYVRAESSDEDDNVTSASQPLPKPPKPPVLTKTVSVSSTSSQQTNLPPPPPNLARMARIPSSTSTTASSFSQVTAASVPKMVRAASSSASSQSRNQPLQMDAALINEVFSLLSETESVGVPAWEVVLCVDNQEYYGNGSKKAIITDLMKLGVRTEVRRLSVGDYLWVLRRRPGPGATGAASGEDVVLDYVMERKRIDDLVSSIVDGRYKEQKARLKNSGRPKTVYLVEEFTAWAANTAGWKLSINPSSLLQSVINTLFIDEFELRMTRDGHHTAVMLAALSRQMEVTLHKIAARCRSSMAFSTDDKLELLAHPVSAPARFSDWNAASSKRKAMTIREMFARQLMCIQGVSADRAIAITSMYPTPASLLEACSLSDSDCEKSLATLKIGSRKLGPALSKRLTSFYSHF